MEYDKNAIGVLKSDFERLVGHLSIEISRLVTYFIEASSENKPTKYVALT